MISKVKETSPNVLILDRSWSSFRSRADFARRPADSACFMTSISVVCWTGSVPCVAARISFDELLYSELAGLGIMDRDDHVPQVILQGAKGVLLRSSTVQVLALALHELTTNALKYGALSRPEGRLRVRWSLVDGAAGDRRLKVEWRESGVPVPPSMRGKPRRRDSGRELIERALPYQLGAETTYMLTPKGVRCTITLPLSTRR